MTTAIAMTMATWQWENGNDTIAMAPWQCHHGNGNMAMTT